LPSQRRFEGTSVEDLLARVHRELGPDAQIVEANKVRKGGLGGFFARETYEVVVEPADGMIAEARITEARITDADIVGAPLGIDADDTNTIDASTIDDAPIRMAHADRSDDELAGGNTDAPTLSTETASFAEILDRLARETVEDDDTDPDDTPPAIAARPTPIQRTRAPRPRDVAAGEPAAVAARAHVWPTLDDLEASDPPSIPVPVVPATPAADEAVATAPVAMPARTPARSAAERSPLTRLGLPVALVPVHTSGRELQVELARRLHALPSAPAVPTGTGSVVAIIGTGSTGVARDLAKELSVDPDSVVVVSQANEAGLPAWLHVADASTAAQRRRSWWRRDRVTVVAVESCEGMEEATWARGVVDALEPTLTWGVVDATRKPEDVAAWAERVGAVDAIALENVRATVSPASILHLGIPIARLDGRRATPERWAQVLVERLAA
jgi:hypothetical protein